MRCFSTLIRITLIQRFDNVAVNIRIDNNITTDGDIQTNQK